MNEPTAAASFSASLKLAAILFLDVKHFSSLNQAQLEKFIEVVLPDLAELISPYRASLLELNTWGDAIIAVSEDPVRIARLALEMRDYFRKKNFEAEGLPRVLQSRISLHAGTVKVGQDPIRQTTGVIGSNVTLAARIEPIILPGEVWATEDFGRMLRPHAAAERLSFDELGPKDLAKGFGTHFLLRLRRSDESPDLSSTAKDAAKVIRRESSLSKPLDLVGIGALNTDYIATATNLRKLKPDLVSEHERHFELGQERSASEDEVKKLISQIGKNQLVLSLGGSSFNTIHALARALPDLRLAFVGVAGSSDVEPGFARLMKDLGIETTCVAETSSTSGICLSYITHGERSLLTHPGANLQMAEHLRDNRKNIVELLGHARMVHVTSLFDAKSPSILAGILREAKDQNPWLQVSFDPGYEWIRRIKSEDNSDALRQILGLSSFLFLNQSEFELLTSDLGINDDQSLAEDIFQHLSRQAVLILLKRYNEILVYHKLNRRMKEVKYINRPLRLREVEDATGAGDVFAAGLFIAIVVPGLEIRDGVALGLQMAQEKISSPGTTSFGKLSSLLEDYVDLKYSHEVEDDGLD